MSNSQKVLWEEGMFLTPHHFQQWDRYQDAVLRQRFRTIQALDWGVRDLQIDTEALLGGQFAVQRCAGVMRDGSFFDAPARDPVPATRGFKEHFDPKAEGLGVHLGIPIVRSGGVTCSRNGSDGSLPTPGVRRTVTVTDETRAGSERELTTVVSNLRILFDGESFDDYESMKIAEIGATATGTYELNQTYVPPCQYFSVSPMLVQLLRRVTEILSSKSEELAGQQRKSGGMAQAARFWLLHTVNSELPHLLHCFHHPSTHPEAVFLELSRVAAQLCTFAAHEHPRNLPIYDHDDLGRTFGELDVKLRFLLDTVIPTRCIEISLEGTDDALFSARLHDTRLLHDARFYLAIGADMPEERLLQEAPAKTKISSRDKIDGLIAMALRGLSLRHVPNPPAEIPVQPGRVYYELEKFGPHWEAIAASRTLSIHIPPDFTELRLELLAVKE